MGEYSSFHLYYISLYFFKQGSDDQSYEVPFDQDEIPGKNIEDIYANQHSKSKSKKKRAQYELRRNGNFEKLLHKAYRAAERQDDE